jgi:hypothetical protein
MTGEKMPDNGFDSTNWYYSLESCEISEIDMDNIIKYLLDNPKLWATSIHICLNEAAKRPIEITDIIDIEYDGHYNNILYKFKEPETTDGDVTTGDYDKTEYKGDISIDRLVGWFRKRVSIKDYEVDYLKFVMREYNSLNKK